MLVETAAHAGALHKDPSPLPVHIAAMTLYAVGFLLHVAHFGMGKLTKLVLKEVRAR